MSGLYLKNYFELWKTNNSINDFKQRKRRLALSCVKETFTLLRGITSKHHGDFYCLNFLHSFRTETKLKFHEQVCKNKDFCWILMPSEKDKILEFRQYMKSDRMPDMVYADMESLINKIDGCANNLDNSSTIKNGEHIPCLYSMSTIWAFDHIENKHTLYPGKYCMKKFWESLWEQRKNIIDFEKKKMLLLTKEEPKSFHNLWYKSMLHSWKKNLEVFTF